MSGPYPTARWIQNLLISQTSNFDYLQIFLQHDPTKLPFQNMHVGKLCNGFDFLP